jgi:hypothetical protein
VHGVGPGEPTPKEGPGRRRVHIVRRGMLEGVMTWQLQLVTEGFADAM